MSANWWEIGKPVQDIGIVSAKEPVPKVDTEDKAKQNWWEIGKPVNEPAKAEAAPVQPAATAAGQGAGMSFQDLFGRPITPQLAASYKAASNPSVPEIYGELERQAIEKGETSNVLVGGVSRTQGLIGNLLEGVSRIPDAIPETSYSSSPVIGTIKSGLTAVAPGLQGAAERFKKESEKVNYSYGTQLKELADNPLNVVPFVLERFAASIPDMAGAMYAAPAYILSLTNETLNERLKNDGRSFEDATVADVAAAGTSAVLQAKLEKFATSRFGKAETILGETALQGGTEAIQEIGQYVAQTAGTKAGFDPTTAGLIGLEAGIAGGGIGLTFAGAQDFAQRRVEARVRGNEELGSKIEKDILDDLRNKAFEKAKDISAPEPSKITVDEGQTEATPIQYGDAYAQKIYDTIGNYIPINAEFKVEEKTVNDAPKFVITDNTGVQYGQDLDSRDRADALASGLNDTTKGRAEVIKQLEPLQSSLSDALKGFGLNDVGLNIDSRIFTSRGKALTSEGLFDPVVRRVFLAVDAIDPQGNLDTNQRREALRGVLRHEVVHALRYLDLWKGSEWKNLEGAASNLKKPGTDKTYLEIAQENYGDQNKVVQVEESVAELIRDVAGNVSRVAGKPRNLSERAINFFDKTKNALNGAGFQTYEDVIRRFEQGAIGARQRGRIRTFRATEEQLAEQGQLPDRVQRLFTTPQDRNQFRQEVAQRVETEIPAATEPARNNLRLNALRESRSTIDLVPPKITVDNQEFPTRDSEGRLIYSGYEGPEVFGIQTRPTQEGLENFWKSFKGSKIVDKQGRPQLYLHGTSGDITAFRPKQAGSVFITKNPRFAEDFADDSESYMLENFTDFMDDQKIMDVVNEALETASFSPSIYDDLAKARDKALAQVSAGKPIPQNSLRIFKDTAAGGRSSSFLQVISKSLPSGPNLIPVYVKADKPWDYDKYEDVKAVIKRARENGADITQSMADEIAEGNWQTIEGSSIDNAPILDAIKQLGYDGMYVEEGGEKNLAVFSPNQVKSAIGNNGDFSLSAPSIRESRVGFAGRPDQVNTPEFKSWFRTSKATGQSGNPIVLYTGTSKDLDFKAFKVSSRGAWFNASPEIASQYAKDNDSKRSVRDPDAKWFQYKEVNTADRVIPVYIRAENPMVYENFEDFSNEVTRLGGASYARGQAALFRNLLSQGYDSVHLKSRTEPEKDTWVVLKTPSQIKSAISNTGEFKEVPKIRESRVRNPQIDTPEFKRFFKDSKIVDENGDPLVLYHGTKKEIDEFKAKYSDGLIFFSTNPQFASKWPVGYGGKGDLREPPEGTQEWVNDIKKVQDEVSAKFLKGDDITPEQYDEFRKEVKRLTGFESSFDFESKAGVNVIPVYISSNKPFNPEKDYKKIEPTLKKMGQENLIDGGYHKSGNWVVYENKTVIDALRDMGYDSIWLREDTQGPTETLAVFSPNQIKSAVGNKGTFDIESPKIRESRKFPAKATPEDVAMAREYLNRTGELPYLSEGQLEPSVPVARQSIKKPYEAKALADGRENHPTLGLPLNKNGTVTLYYPATNEMARRAVQDKRLKGSTPTSNRVYLTNESSGPKVMENRGNIDQPMDGANVLVQVDPSLLHFDQEYKDGRKDFFIQLAEGESYANKMKQTKLFTLDAPRTRALSKDTNLADIERSISDSVTKYLALDAKGRRARLKKARDVLKKEHNVGTLLGENGKLQKTRLGDYGLTYEGKSVASMGLGMASAQRINEKNLSTCPRSAICEGLCLGETSGQNRLYGGEGQFKSGPRLSQYLKTEAIVQNPEDFAIVLYDEIAKFEKWSNSEVGFEEVKNEAGEDVMQPKQVYQPAIRLNVTSDFRPQTFASIINAFPDVMFYDYTKLSTRSIAKNHHLTYSSTGASQVVNGETIVNPESNWDKMVQQLNDGMNVAMAFTSRTDMPDFVIDERTGQRFQVWDGDNYDARFLDPKRADGIGMIVGLSNKDSTTKPEEAAKKHKGFFLDYDRARDGDALVIPNQGKLRVGAAPKGPVAEEARPPAAREARRRGTPIGPTQPGPTNDTDNTSAAEALNGGQPVDSIGTPIGPTISDTEPDGTVDISGARIAPFTRRLVVQMIQSAPDKLRSGLGLDDLAKRIENYYDTYDSRLGVANGVIRDAFKRIDIGGKGAALTTFEQFIRARENNRVDDAQAIFDAATESERQLIDAWKEIARQTGEINTSIRTPDDKPMRVWDAKVSEWRPIRSVPNFFPRTFRREVMEVMRNPDLDPALWQSLLDSLVSAGRAGTTQEAEKYLLREWFSDEVAQDYFAGVEKARTNALPEIFYDYSWDAATRYLRKWSRRTAQIENFGQTVGKFQKEWFDANIPKVRDQETQNYLNSIKERIYETEQFNVLTNMASWANSLATATQLGNWISASLNLLGGTITNIQQFGIKEISKSYANLALDWKNVQNKGTTLGVLNKDFMNILNDHVEMDADKYFSKEQKVSQALGKFTNVMLTVGGFNAAENVVRSSAMLAATSRLNSFLRDVNNGLENNSVRRFREWVKRENLDIDALVIEDGAGKETEKFIRRAVNVSQGSYKIDMTPVFIDTAAGRFFLKYQKFGTQVNRFFYNHFLKTFYDNPTPQNFVRIAGFLGTAIIGGGAILAVREAFGYGDPGPDDEEIKKAFENKDTSRAWGLIFSRAWQNIMAAGSLGFFGNYAQFAKDYQDQQRVKNPFSPPGLASVDAVVNVLNKLRDQGKITARDLDEIAETTMSFYRASKRTTLAAMDTIGSDAREVRRFAAQKEIREVREYGRRYSEAMDIEFKRTSAPGAFASTPMTPVNKSITDALHQGDVARARLLIRNALKGLRGKEKERVEASIRSSARNRQPIQIGGSAPNKQELRDFMRWSRQNLPAEKYQMIRRTDLRYKRAATKAGIEIGG